MLKQVDLAAQSVLNCLDGTAYVVDADGLLVAFGTRNWRKFAEANGSPDLADEKALIGRPLLDFVLGDDVRAHWSAALDLLKKGTVDTIVMPYRCDSPGMHRAMRMAVTTFSDFFGGKFFLFHSVTLSERPRPAIALFDHRKAERPPSDLDLPVVAICSFCNSVRPGPLGRAWLSPEAYYVGGGSSHVHITHSVCPSCHSDLHRSLSQP